MFPAQRNVLRRPKENLIQDKERYFRVSSSYDDLSDGHLYFGLDINLFYFVPLSLVFTPSSSRAVTLESSSTSVICRPKE